MLACLALALGSCASTMRLTATAPTQDNDGTCTVPVLLAANAGAARVVHFAWSGPEAGEDSVVTTVGAPVSLVRTIRPGTYTIRAWASSSAGVSCDTTLVRTYSSPPWRPVLQ